MKLNRRPSSPSDYCDGIEKPSYFFMFAVIPPIMLFFAFNVVLSVGFAIIIGVVLGFPMMLLRRLMPLGPMPAGKYRVLLVTDNAPTQISGVLRKYNELRDRLRDKGHDVKTIDTGDFIAFHMPRYKEVSIAWPTPWLAFCIIKAIAWDDPQVIDVLTEGNMGIIVRTFCSLTFRKYTTMWCTRADLYAHEFMGPFAAFVGRKFMSLFHQGSYAVITPSPSMGRELVRLGCVSKERCRPILNGVNTDDFSPEGPLSGDMVNLKRPIWMYCGRVSHEKNILAFLHLSERLPGSIAIVGKGPFYDAAVKEYASDRCVFLGWRSGMDLSACYRTADVFVFPSRTDTFGQVIVEAMASGVPVAAFPVTGPIDLVVEGTGAVDNDLYKACTKALAERNVSRCVEHAKTFSWARMAEEFLDAHDLEGRKMA